MIYFLFFALLFVSIPLLLGLIFVRQEPVNLLLFLLFALLTIIVNAIFMMSLQNNEEQLHTVAYISGGLAILTTTLRFALPNTDLFCKIAIVLLFIFALFGAFFL